MKNQNTLGKRNVTTGSYTVRVSKSARTGNFISESPRIGKIKIVGGSTSTSSD